MKNSIFLSTLLASALTFPLTTQAQEKTSDIKATSATSVDMTDGEIRKLDKDAKKVTIKHGEIKNLDMPGMTMVFRVKDPAVLDTFKVGDKVKFKAEKADGAIFATEIQVAK